MYSNRMRMTGMSGVDTETMVRQMMKAESLKLDKLQQKNQVLLWKQEAYRSYSSDFTSFQTKFFSFSSPKTNLYSSALFQGLESTVKVAGVDSNVISVRPGSGVKAGNHRLEVDKIARGDKFESAEMQPSIIGEFPIDITKIKAGDSFTMSLDGGKEKTFTFTDTDILEINATGDLSGLERNLQQKMNDAFGKVPDFSSGFSPGSGSQQPGDPKVQVAIMPNANGEAVISFAPGLGHTISIKDKNNTAASFTGSKVTGLNISDMSGLTFEIKEGDKAFQVITLKDDYTDENSLNDLLKDINSQLKGTSLRATIKDDTITFVNGDKNQSVEIKDTGALDKLGMVANGGDSFTLEQNSSTAGLGIIGSQNNQIKIDKTLEELFGYDGATALDFTINGKEIDGLTGSNTLRELMSAVNQAGAGVTLSYNQNKGQFVLESSSTGASAKIDIGGVHGAAFKNILGFGDTPTVEARDATFIFNGVSTYRSENSFTIDGIGITLTEAAEGKTIDINLSNNSDNAYDAIMEFVADYNELVGKLQKEVKQTRATTGRYSYYAPLTEEQKKELSDKEIERWEGKAKEGLLYRDDIFTDALRDMRNLITMGVEYDDGSVAGGKIFMHDIGITTSNRVKDGGVLEIDHVKLRAALESRGQEVEFLFAKKSDISPNDKENQKTRIAETGVAGRLNESINRVAVGYSSKISQRAGYVGSASEHDNLLYKQISAQNSKIEQMNEYLARKENHYYAMFARMESAMAQADSQMGYLMQMMGGG